MSATAGGYASRRLLGSPGERLSSGRTALVVGDMQNDFCAPGGYIAGALGKDVLGLATILPSLQALLAVARGSGLPVVWLAARYEEDLLPPSMLAQKRRLGIEAICCAGDTWGADFFGVAPRSGEPVFSKSTYSGFSNPAFEAHLRAAGIEALVFCGVQTNVCVESTLREAHTRGFDVAIVRDAVASHAPALHEGTLANVGFLFGDVVTAADLTGIWSAVSRPAA